MKLPKLPAWWPLAAVGAVLALYVTRKHTRNRTMTGAGGRMSQSEIDSTFGPLPYTEGAGGKIKVDPSWVSANIVQVPLFDGRRVRLHRAIAKEFAAAYEAAVKASGYHPKSVQTWVARHILWDPKRNLSNHSWGIAVDFDPNQNPRGAKRGILDRTPAFVAEMEKAGWVWGGRWSPASRDAMHFERTSRRPLPT